MTSQPYTPHFMAIPYGEPGKVEGHSKIVNVDGMRPHVLAWIRGTKVPFYISTGLGGKKSVETGKWYPHFGFGKDKWLNKGPEEVINASYGSRHLKAVSDWLNHNVGDIRDNYKLPDVDSIGPHIDAMNSDLSPVNLGEGALPNVQATVSKIHTEPRHPSQAERLQDANAHALLRQHSKEHPELDLGITLP